MLFFLAIFLVGYKSIRFNFSPSTEIGFNIGLKGYLRATIKDKRPKISLHVDGVTRKIGKVPKDPCRFNTKIQSEQGFRQVRVRATFTVRKACFDMREWESVAFFKNRQHLSAKILCQLHIIKIGDISRQK
jgi:hypothetical protein